MLTRLLASIGVSPKVVATVVLALLAAVGIWLISGDDSYLIAILIVLAGGAAGVLAPAAVATDRRPVTQAEVQAVAELPVHDRPKPRRRRGGY